MEIKIPYKPRDYQLAVHNDPHRFKVVVWHRQSGKTTYAINELIKQMVARPGVYLYVAPEKAQAKNIIWKDPTVLFKYLPDELIAKKLGKRQVNEVELTIRLVNKSVFYLEGADNPDRLRGIKPYGVILDEYAQMDPATWEEILFPAINQSGGWVIFIGTFKGKNHFYKFFSKYWDWSKAESIENQDYKAFYLPAKNNPFFTEDMDRRAKDSMPPGAYNQEYQLLPMDGVSTVFPSIVELMTGSLKNPDPTHFYSMGIDLAKHVDYTAVSVIDRNTHELVYQERWQGDWSTTLDKIILIRNRYNRAHVTIDSTGVGDPVAETLSRRGIKCDDFKFSQKSKDQLVKKMGIFFAEKKIVLPPQYQIPNLTTELEQFSYEILPSGKYRYSAPDGLHDDEVMSLGLAIWFLDDVPSKDTYSTHQPITHTPSLDPFDGGNNLDLI